MLVQLGKKFYSYYTRFLRPKSISNNRDLLQLERGDNSENSTAQSNFVFLAAISHLFIKARQLIDTKIDHGCD